MFKGRKKRWSHDSKGLVLRDKNGIVFVPYQQTPGGWYAVTLHDPNGVYQRTGYNILVPDGDVETADQLSLDFDEDVKDDPFNA